MTIVSFLLTHHGVTCSRAEGLAVSHAEEGVEPDPEEDADKEQQETTDRYTEQPSLLGLAPQCAPASFSYGPASLA